MASCCRAASHLISPSARSRHRPPLDVAPSAPDSGEHSRLGEQRLLLRSTSATVLTPLVPENVAAVSGQAKFGRCCGWIARTCILLFLVRIRVRASSFPYQYWDELGHHRFVRTVCATVGPSARYGEISAPRVHLILYDMGKPRGGRLLI
ncbi:hypothetical protein JCGZ_25534 [Jatropha curcas]|uniref:Uncharacterized protein n=1 Tax=Jatropha curcas TaxID=180498 RepID=A0A067JP58_JATCU|nr:hypothetical protein JCGZ_25534 [Jatropha curcas]